MASSSAALVALLVASCAGMAAAASFTVGDAQGWVAGIDYSGWTSGKSFSVGDTLVFTYASKVHTVTEVSKSGYAACSGSSALGNDDSGSTTVTLATPGTHYYICNIPGHCSSGMKLAVNVAGGGSGSGSSSGSGAGIPSGAAGVSVPAMMSAIVLAAASGALIKAALF